MSDATRDILLAVGGASVGGIAVSNGVVSPELLVGAMIGLFLVVIGELAYTIGRIEYRSRKRQKAVRKDMEADQ